MDKRTMTTKYRNTNKSSPVLRIEDRLSGLKTTAFGIFVFTILAFVAGISIFFFMALGATIAGHDEPSTEQEDAAARSAFNLRLSLLAFGMPAPIFAGIATRFINERRTWGVYMSIGALAILLPFAILFLIAPFFMWVLPAGFVCSVVLLIAIASVKKIKYHQVENHPSQHD